MKHKLIITAFFFLFAIGAQAQDKYQFMVIRFYTSVEKIYISIDGNEFSKEDVSSPKDQKLFSVNPLLKKVKEYQDKNWEVMSFLDNNALFTAYLRKKIETK